MDIAIWSVSRAVCLIYRNVHPVDIEVEMRLWILGVVLRLPRIKEIASLSIRL